MEILLIALGALLGGTAVDQSIKAGKKKDSNNSNNSNKSNKK